jgi:FAD synthetase
MKTVIAFGTFDLFHKGHESFLRQAKEHGERLVVVVATDRNVLRIKGRRPAQGEERRLARISWLPFVDLTVLGREDFDYTKTLIEHRPDVICLGYDQEGFGLEKKLQGTKVRIVRLKPYEEKKYKSSILRRWLDKF